MDCIVRFRAADYSAGSTRHNAPQAGADPLGRIGTCSFQESGLLRATGIVLLEYSLAGILKNRFVHHDLR
jgi:hypothetical protein